MALGSQIMLGFAACGGYGGGRGPGSQVGPPRSPARQSPVAHSPRPVSNCAGRARSVAVVVCALVCVVATVLVGSAGHTPLWSTFRHLAILLTGTSLRLVARDPLLVGTALCVLFVLMFTAVVVALTSPVSVVGPVARRNLVVRLGGTGQVRPRRRPARGSKAVARRPPNVQSTRPEGRPAPRTRAFEPTE